MAEKRKLSEAVKVPAKEFMTPDRKRARRDDESPPYSAAVEVELPNTAEARRIAAEETKKENDASKAAKGIDGGRRRKSRTMRRKSRKHRKTHKKRKF